MHALVGHVLEMALEACEAPGGQDVVVDRDLGVRVGSLHDGWTRIVGIAGHGSARMPARDTHPASNGRPHGNAPHLPGHLAYDHSDRQGRARGCRSRITVPTVDRRSS